MSHIDNIREMESLGYNQKFNQRKGYLKACKQFEKEIEALKEEMLMLLLSGEMCEDCINNAFDKLEGEKLI